MEIASYVLCAATALACAFLLLRSYWRKRVPLLLWCSLFFLALTVENVVLFLDRVVVPDTDLSILQNSIGLSGLALLLYGLIWDIK